MIPRYSRPEATHIWSDGVRFQLWLDIELALVEVFEEEGLAPRGTAEAIRAGTTLNPERILEIDLPWPRDLAVKNSAAFTVYVREIQEIFHGYGVI